MMKRYVLLAMMLAGSANAADEDAYSAPDRDITLDAATTARLGIAAVAATEQSIQTQARGLGQVLGLDVLAQTDADLSIAESAAAASQAALVRAEGMFKADTGISRQALEAAQHQAATDAAQLSLAQRKAQAAWGRDPPWRDASSRRALMNKLSSGEAVIVRAVLANAPEGQPVMRVEKLGAPGSKDKPTAWTAKSVWSAPADPTVPGRVYYLLLENAKDLGEGERVRVIASSGEAQKGAYVPASAVIIAEGATWLYIETQPNYFVRQAIDIGQPSGGGYVLLHGVQPGEKVVVAGAGHLLAKETGTESD